MFYVHLFLKAMYRTKQRQKRKKQNRINVCISKLCLQVHLEPQEAVASWETG